MVFNDSLNSSLSIAAREVLATWSSACSICLMMGLVLLREPVNLLGLVEAAALPDTSFIHFPMS